ncbi:hypothetical protein C8R43DRAFT_885374, partial [Mycena crocata]
MWLIGAYIPPVTSRWQGWTEVYPFEQLWETVAICSPSEDKPVALLTDINGRTGSKQVPRYEHKLPRKSKDDKINTRGHEILNGCDNHGLCIINGTTLETSSSGRLTSWQPGGRSTIDLAMVSESLVPLIKSFHIEEPAPDPKNDWADHTRICLTLDASAVSRSAGLIHERDTAPDFAGTRPVDILYQETMAARET